MNQPTKTELQFARRIVRVLKERARAGILPNQFHPDPTKWAGVENGYGTEIGSQIDALVAAAERLIARDKSEIN